MNTARIRLGAMAVVAIALYGWLAAAPADAAVFRYWQGSLTGTHKMSDANNWDGSTVPATADYLTFGQQVVFQGDIINDLAGFSATRLTFTGGYGFALSGNPLTVTESIVVNNDGGEHSIALNIAGATQTLVGRNAVLHLSGTNTFSGDIDVYGRLYVESNGALGSTAGVTRINPGAEMRIAGRDLAEPLRIVGGDGACALRNEGGTSILRNLQYAGASCITNNGTLSIPNGLGEFAPGFDLLLAYGEFQVGGTTNATGPLRLGAVGNLLWDSSAQVDIMSSEIESGAQMDLRGSGTAASLDFFGATFAPGSNGGTGRFSLSGAFAIHDAKLALGLNGTTAGTGHSAVQAGGPVTIGPNTALQLALTIGYTPVVGSQYRIIDNTGSQAVSGTFKDLPEGAKFFQSGVPWSITYNGGSGNDAVVTALQPDLRPFKRFVPLVAAGN